MLDLQRGEADDEPPAEAERRAEREPELEGQPALAEDRDRVRSERHEGAMRQRDLPGVAQGEIEADGHHEVDEREARHVQLVLLEPERQEREEDQQADRQEAPERPALSHHDAHSSLTPQRPSGFQRRTAMRITSTTASRNWPGR